MHPTDIPYNAPDTVKANKNMKDSVFSAYFSEEPARLVELFNALEGTGYPLDTPVEINTLQGHAQSCMTALSVRCKGLFKHLHICFSFIQSKTSLIPKMRLFF